jgi:hypothetical protein
MEKVLGWEARHVAGAPGGPAIPDELLVALPEHATTLRPTWAVAELGETERPWQLLVRIEAPGVDPDARNALDGWEATPHQRFERLLRDTNVFAGLLISERETRQDGEVRYHPELRLIYAPRGETSGHQSFPIRPMATVAGRPMLGGLKLLLDRFRLFSDSDGRRLPALLKRSRDAQALVSTALAEQVLGALHELLRGLHSAEPTLVRELSTSRPDHLYEGLLTAEEGRGNNPVRANCTISMSGPKSVAMCAGRSLPRRPRSAANAIPSSVANERGLRCRRPITRWQPPKPPVGNGDASRRKSRPGRFPNSFRKGHQGARRWRSATATSLQALS